MLNSIEGNEEFVECDGLGNPVIEDFSGKTFFNGFINHSTDLRIYRGDCVKVNLDEVDAAGERFAFGQVNAIFSQRIRIAGLKGIDDHDDHAEELDHGEEEEKLLVEIRWLHKPIEVAHIKK